MMKPSEYNLLIFGTRVILLQHQQGFAFGGGEQYIAEELLPGLACRVASARPDGLVVLETGKSCHIGNLRVPSSLPPCPWAKGDKVAWIPEVETFPADKYSPEFSINVRYVRGVRYPMAEPWEKIYNKHGIFFHRPYEIENIVDKCILNLKGVKDIFYWEFFTRVHKKGDKHRNEQI